MNEREAKGRTRVVKLGGSLLDWSELRMRLRDWLSLQPPAKTVLLVGGGAFADVIRDADKIHSLGEVASHWLCVQALSVSALLGAKILHDAIGPLGPDEISSLDCAPALVLLDVPKLMQLDLQRSIRPLPAAWDVTTDSIAARAAVMVSADELVLLKSTLPEKPGPLRALAEQDYVDAHFPICAKSIAQIRLVNLRDAKFSELTISHGR